MTRRVVFDLEANGLYDTATHAHCGVFSDIDTGEVFKFVISKGDLQDMLSFMEGCATLIGHNIINFDLPLLDKLYNWKCPKTIELVDTLVMSRILNPDRPIPKGAKTAHSVEAYGIRFGILKPEHEDWSKYSPEMLHRCTMDVEIQHLIYTYLQSEAGVSDMSKSIFDKSGYTPGNVRWYEVFDKEHKSAKIMTEQEIAGVFFETGYATECLETLDELIQGIEERVLKNVPYKIKPRGVTVSKPFKKNGEHTKAVLDWYETPYCYDVVGPFTRIRYESLNLASDKQVKEWLFTQGWEPDEWNYKKDPSGGYLKDDDGNLIRTSPKVTESSLEKLGGELGIDLTLRSKAAHRRSQIQGWVDRVREDHRITAGANPQGTNTGRMRHRVVANIPKPSIDKDTHDLVFYPDYQKVFFGTEMRSMFSAGPNPNRVLVGRDASGLELRCFAHYLDDDNYTKIILEGDIHTYNQETAGLPTRDDAKTFIYAFLYGGGAGKLGEIVLPNGTKEEKAAVGQALKESFLTANPKLAKLVKEVQKSSERGWLLGLDGRKIHMRRKFGRIQKNKALNTLLQSAGAVIMTYSRIWLHEEVEKRGWLDSGKVVKVLDYHDEETYECDVDISEEMKELMIQSVVEAGLHYKLKCPLDAGAAIGQTWAVIH